MCLLPCWAMERTLPIVDEMYLDTGSGCLLFARASTLKVADASGFHASSYEKFQSRRLVDQKRADIPRDGNYYP
ncbi:hypothetical protein DEO72_LG8g1769 [Vigna unguiculata]|uniref:Uncharacterized protein n=1 Tax=Vigna unguiculata TaxID=3917 RepID=A0A4D6MQP6_VIGUN|nr:hypothetical protein DEO72_LG8g1769 [Vigna unguiculata]